MVSRAGPSTSLSSKPVALSVVPGIALLALANFFNVVDRKIVAILADPIKHDLGLSDTEVGLLTGFVFATAYAFAAVPVARLLDRGDRARILAVAVGFWSLMTLLCGSSQTFGRLLLARMGVAVGEAAASPASYSLVSDYVQPARRTHAMACITVATSVGTLIAFSAGGYLADTMDWRLAFFAVGSPGLVLALLLWWRLPEPRRSASFLVADPVRPGRLVPDLIELARSRALVTLLVGTCLLQFSVNALLIWSGSLLQRSYGWSVMDAGFTLGLTFGITGVVSPIGAALLSNRVAIRRPGAPAQLLAILSALAAVALGGALLTFNPSTTVLLIGGTYILIGGWTPLVMTAFRSLVGSRRIALAIAMLGVCMNLLGIGLGPLAVGGLSDALHPQFGQESLRYALCFTLPVLFLGATALQRAAVLMDHELGSRDI